MTPGRVVFIDRKKESDGLKLHDKAGLQSTWVSQLKRGRRTSGLEEAELETLFKISNTMRFSSFTIEGLISTMATADDI
jgi:hypothetical protein